jgi:hypothetical protein
MNRHTGVQLWPGRASPVGHFRREVLDGSVAFAAVVVRAAAVWPRQDADSRPEKEISPAAA